MDRSFQITHNLIFKSEQAAMDFVSAMVLHFADRPLTHTPLTRHGLVVVAGEKDFVRLDASGALDNQEPIGVKE